MNGDVNKVYVSGPMSGIARFNIPAFDLTANALRKAGYDVVSPAELDEPAMREACLASPDGKSIPNGETWGELLARDVKLLADDGIEAIVVLPGWHTSRGAILETMVGRLCGLPICVTTTNDYGRLVLEQLPDRALQQAHAAATGIVHPNIDDLLKDFPPTHTSPSLIAREEEGAEAVTGEVRTRNETTGGEKGAKPEAYNLIPWDQMHEVARLYHRGAQKYEPDNWKRGYDWSLSFSSLIRHAITFWQGQSLDPETRCHHLSSVVFHALTLMYFEQHHPALDDRRCG